MSDLTELRKKAAQQSQTGNYWAGKCVGLIDRLESAQEQESLMWDDINRLMEERNAAIDLAQAMAAAIGADTPGDSWVDKANNWRQNPDTVPRLQLLLVELRRVLADLTDDNDCHLDHHGYCQTHDWLDDDAPCPNPRAKALLANLDTVEDE